MRTRKQTALGIDVRGRRVNLALVEKDDHGFRTVAAAGGDLPDGLPEQGGKTTAKALSGLLAQLGRRARGAKAVLALSADSVVMQLLDLPARVPTNVGAFVNHELQQYVALSGKTVVSDYCRLTAGTGRRLLAAAADADEVQELTQTCETAGITVEATEPSTLACLRALLERRTDLRRGGTVLVALLDPRRLTICLCRLGTLDYIRARDLPADTNTCRPLCVWLSEELKAVERYDDTRVAVPGRDRRMLVVIHDDVHTAAEIAPVLAAEGGMEAVTVVDGWEPLPGSGNDGPSAPSVSLAAVGAALMRLEAGADTLRVNLLPRAVTEARSLTRHLLLTANLSVILFLAIFAATQLLTRTTNAKDQDLQRTRLAEEFYAMPALLTEERFLDQEIACLGQRLGPLRRVLGTKCHAGWPDILDTIRQAAPAELSVGQVQSSDGRTLSLKGFAPSCPAVQAFVQNLDGRGLLESVTRVRVQRQQDTDGRLEYQIDCRLKEPSPARDPAGGSPLKGGTSS